MIERSCAEQIGGSFPGQGENGADRPAAIAACVGLAMTGFVTFMGMPMVVGAVIEQLGYTEGQGGYMASAEYLGMLVASTLVSLLTFRFSRRRLAAVGVLLAVASNAASVFVTAPPHLLAIRFLSGLGSGTAYAVSVAILAGSTRTVRNYMFLIFGQVLTNALIVYMFPAVLVHWHIAGIFTAYCGFLCAAGVCLPWLPRRFALTYVPISEAAASPHESLPPFVPWLCLFAVFCFYMMIGAYWAYIEVIGVSLGFDVQFVGQVIAMGILLSLLACLVAYRLSQCLGQSKPLLFALGIVAVIHIGGGLWFGPAAYFVGLGVVNCFWHFTDIYQLGTIANIDHTGVFASRVPGAQMLAMTVSPIVAGWLLDRNLGYPSLLILLGAYVAVAFAAYTVVYALLRRRVPQLADAT